MKSAILTVLLGCALAAHAVAHDGTKESSKGYVLKTGEGEVLGTDIIKASPKSGTQGGVVILQPMAKGFSTGLHVHLKADEFFYVVSGHGYAQIGSKSRPVSEGDFIFVPAGQDHKLFVGASGAMKILEFLDKPGLDEEFRAWHKAELQGTVPSTLDEVNKISRPHGTIYKTLE